MKSGRFRPGVGWFVLAIALAGGGARGAPPDLVRIDPSGPSSLARLARTAAPPVRILDGYALAWCPAESLDAVRALGFDLTRLATRQEGMEYAVVYRQGRTGDRPTLPLGAFGRVLSRGTNTVVLEVPRGQAEALWNAYEIVPIPDRPIRFPPARRPALALPPPEADAAIADLVAAVDAEKLLEVARALEGFGSRLSATGPCRNAGSYLEERFRGFGLNDVAPFDYAPSLYCDNIVATQRGATSPEEYYVIGGHYDSFSQGGPAPGADDNASGTSGVMEVARLLAPLDFEATIVYTAFGGEEQGLVGSEAWASWARDEGLDIRGMINLDMIGYLPLGMIGDLDLIFDSTSLDLRDLAFSTIPLYLPDYDLVESALVSGNSDQQSFWDQGFPAVLFHEDTGYANPFLHTPNDRVGPSLNNIDFMRKNVQAAVALLATLARPLRIRIEHTPLADPSSDADGYPVVARFESNTPLWEDSLLVRYRVDGGAFRSIRMEALGEADLYGATIPRQEAGSLVEYEIYARDIEGRTTHDPLRAPRILHQFLVGLVTFYADGFDEDLGWTVGTPEDDATSGDWVRAEPVGTGAQPEEDADPDSGGFCFVTGNGPPGGEIGKSDVDGGRTTVTSPRFDLSEAVRMRIAYSRWYVDETYPDDTLRVYLSNDDGQSWELLEAVGSSERAWKEVRFDAIETLLPLTGSMRLRFVAEDVGQPSLVEAAVDRVVVGAVYPASGTPSAPAGAGLTAAWPLPFRGEVTIGYDLPEEASVRLAVYDLLGRRVVDVAGGLRGAGPHEASWDGEDGRGEPVPSGIYFVRLEVDGREAGTLRIPRVR